jgi:hypothetical protein
MRHLLFPGGKRLRPALALAAAEAVGAPPERAIPVAVAVELVHTYSLIHDDLPCMDDDSLRRGLPTVHVAFGEATAVLAGDALLAAAFFVLTAAERDHPAPQLLAAARDLAEAAGCCVWSGADRRSALRAARSRRRARRVRACAQVGGADRRGDRGRRAAGRWRCGRAGRAAPLRGGARARLPDRRRPARCPARRGLLAGALDRRARSARARRGAARRGAPRARWPGEHAEPLREIARHAVRRTE